MNLDQAIEVLKKEGVKHSAANNAVEAIKDVIANSSTISLSKEVECSELSVILSRLAAELLQSTKPAFSDAILRALLESIALGKREIENDFALKTLFIKETLGSETVRDGLWKCMIALGTCTKSYYE